MVEHDLYYGFHDLRHFMATYLSDTEKVSLKTTSGLLRHKNLKTAEIYLHPVDESGVNPTDCTKYDRVLDRIITP